MAPHCHGTSRQDAAPQHTAAPYLGSLRLQVALSVQQGQQRVLPRPLGGSKDALHQLLSLALCAVQLRNLCSAAGDKMRCCITARPPEDKIGCGTHSRLSTLKRGTRLPIALPGCLLTPVSSTAQLRKTAREAE
jgi:hypothetical protein